MMPETPYFEYGEKETAYLKSRDPLLGAVIDEIGHLNRAVNPDMFAALLNAIVGQQISAKAQATVWGRMLEKFVSLTPETIGAAPAEELQACGITLRKAFYIKEIADSVLGGSLDLAHLQTLPDDEVCARLSQIKGVGVWTAEMLMTFSLQRPNVMSFDDLAIHRGLRMLYHHRRITPELFAKYKRRYSPYATVASLYLWAIAGGACPRLVDYAPKSDARKKADARKRRKQVSKDKTLFMDEVKVIEWEDKYSEDFVSLSIEWLNKYVSVEPSDLEILNHPHAMILDQGGNIFFAKYADRIIGTVAMIKNDTDNYELAKLAVTEEFKGQRIGNKLMEKCIQFAQEKGAKMIVLYTNHKLLPAIGLYKKYGFKEVTLKNNKYLESDMKMELSLISGESGNGS